ncbi:hypothetical protein DPMN_151708 [Dreissena polymorpha]|uniref:Uncharacterized protein n=1 Tax=Dreissena polymorpha TaxID=45954 RepID=A0A9D4FIZ6_DREPO|nr:hypothetical protein DPMN_151708 [Dreissena polymorpha]
MLEGSPSRGMTVRAGLAEPPEEEPLSDPLRRCIEISIHLRTATIPVRDSYGKSFKKSSAGDSRELHATAADRKLPVFA